MRLALVLLLVFLLTMAAACTDGDNAAHVVGELASDRIELTADVAEPIVAIHVDEGTVVRAGDALFEQDGSRAAARLVEAEAGLAEARSRLDELVRGPRAERIASARASLEGAETDLVFRKTEFARMSEVAARKLASPEDLDRARAELDTASANVAVRRAELAEHLAGTTVEELAQAEAAVRQAEARVATANVDLERHVVRAPVGGVADSRLFEVGERPNPGQPVMVLLAGEQVHARVYVPEALRVRIKPGTPVILDIDGLDATVAGSVRWIASEAAFTPYYALTERDRGRLSYLAKIDIDDAIERLPDGVPLEARFVIGDTSPAGQTTDE